jgi:hypothetical protein
VGSRAGLDDMEKWKFLPPPGLELRIDSAVPMPNRLSTSHADVWVSVSIAPRFLSSALDGDEWYIYIYIYLFIIIIIIIIIIILAPRFGGDS